MSVSLKWSGTSLETVHWISYCSIKTTNQWTKDRRFSKAMHFAWNCKHSAVVSLRACHHGGFWMGFECFGQIWTTNLTSKVTFFTRVLWEKTFNPLQKTKNFFFWLFYPDVCITRGHMLLYFGCIHEEMKKWRNDFPFNLALNISHDITEQVEGDQQLTGKESQTIIIFLKSHI